MIARLTRRLIVLACAAALLAGCESVPKDGPRANVLQGNSEVTLAQTAPPVGYALVHLSPLVLAAANAASRESNTFSQLGSRASKDVRIGTGDLLNLTIFESQAGGLFIPQEAGSRAGNFVSIPNQQVDQGGSITVPYAGSIRVVGRTARDVSEEISKKLMNRAIEPQVVVTIQERRGNEVSVLGDVNLPQRFPLDPGGINLLGAIARAGGPKDPPYETVVSIQRGGRTVHGSMTSIVNNARENVALAAGDVVYVSREPKVYVALGATPSPGSVGGINNRRFVFDNDNMSLTEAVAKAGGLAPDRADATAVFIFRMEPRKTLAQMGVDVSAYKAESVPTIYQADWSKSDAFFLGNSFYMRDKDVIFVSEHPTQDITKFSNIVRGFTAPGSDVGTLLNGAR